MKILKKIITLFLLMALIHPVQPTYAKDKSPAPTKVAEDVTEDVADEVPPEESTENEGESQKNYTAEELEILNRGEINSTSYAIGGVLGTFVGFGLGHAVQNRYISKGLIITLGEVVSLTILIAGLVNCVSTTVTNSFSTSIASCSTSSLTIGYLGFVGFRIFELVDVWVAPIGINDQYRALKGRGQTRNTDFIFAPVASQGSGQIDGAKLSFQYQF